MVFSTTSKLPSNDQDKAEDRKIDRQAIRLSTLIVKRARKAALAKISELEFLDEDDLAELRDEKIKYSQVKTALSLIVRGHCNCVELAEKERKRFTIAALHRYWQPKFRATINGESADPIAHFREVYEPMFNQLDIPPKASMREVDPNLYSYYSRAKQRTLS